MAGTLWLFHRATGDQPNAVAELSLEHVERSLREDQRLDCEELVGLRRYDLGRLDHVPLAFSDATPLADHVVVFTASAEDTRTAASTARWSAPSTATDLCGGCAPSTAAGRSRASTPPSTQGCSTWCSSPTRTTRRPSPLLSATMPIDGRIELERDRGLR